MDDVSNNVNKTVLTQSNNAASNEVSAVEDETTELEETIATTVADATTMSTINDTIKDEERNVNEEDKESSSNAVTLQTLSDFNLMMKTLCILCFNIVNKDDQEEEVTIDDAAKATFQSLSEGSE